jgi:fructokinase
MKVPKGDLDLLAIGETLVDFISVEETDWLRNAYTFRKYQGGSPANIAVYVAKLGSQSAVISKLGIGAMAQFLKSELNRAGVLTEYLVMDHLVHSSIVFVSRTAKTADFEAFRSSDFQLTPSEINEEAIERAKVIHASTWALSREPCRSAVKKAFELGRKRGKIISLDPNYSPQIWPDYREAKAVLPEMLSYATITKPSRDDASRLFGRDKEPEEYIQRYHDMGPEVVVFTMGGDGVLLSDGEKLTHMAARKIKVVDATGAGDSFWAGFLVALLDGRPLEDCALFAREIVERKLTTVGPLPDNIDRQQVYAKIDAETQEVVETSKE